MLKDNAVRLQNFSLQAQGATLYLYRLQRNEGQQPAISKAKKRANRHKLPLHRVALAFSQGTERNTSALIIQANSHQMPWTVSALRAPIQNSDLQMKGFRSYYQFPRYLILTLTNSSFNLLFNLSPNCPQLLPLGIHLTSVYF